ncbi:MAG: FtsX-like permease family protein [Saprospiraceae bacterium]|nr:FtsX-like permease family protein [Saprospiraceae bacterium]
MLRNYLKIAWRNTWKNKLWSFINISSLALGIAACLLIFLFIQDERSFDAFHNKGDRIYRLDEVQSFPGTNTQKVALSMPGMGPALLRDYPEVENFSRYWTRGKHLFIKDDRKILIEETVFVDSSFLEIFDFPLLSGNRQSALKEPNSIVLTKESASKIFSNPNPIGNFIDWEDNTFEVTGILTDVPENSHLQFDALVSMATATSEQPEFDNQFGSNYLNTYLLVKPSTDIKNLESKMPDFLLRCMPPDEDDAGTINDYYKIFFQKLPQVHLASMDIEHDYNNYRKFNGAYLNVFFLIGLLILMIAGVNFMNLITARASHRWKEVGVRKTIGAQKIQMFRQFSVESGMLGVLAFLFGLLIAIICTPLLNRLLDRTLSFTYFLDHPLMLAGALACTISLSFLAGIYPSYYLASFKTVNILKGTSDENNKSIFRSSLVILQFGLAIGMIICTFIVVQQLYYVTNKDIGLNKDHILLVDMNNDANEVFETLKNELKRNNLVKGVTASGQRLGNNFHQWGFKLRTDSVRGLTPSNVNVDYDYLDVYEIKLREGRNFSHERPRDNGYAFIINESFAKELNLENPIGVSAGHSWYPDDSLGTIIGVVQDFNFNSLHYAINTLSLVVHEEWGYDELSLKIDGNNIENAIAEVERIWNNLVPKWPFQYSFLDEHFETLYQSDQQMEAVVKIMALLAILIACMGLFGLAAITTEKRIKEIGIRKVLGASLQNIMIHLSKNFALLIVLAFVIFSPVTYF